MTPRNHRFTEMAASIGFAASLLLTCSSCAHLRGEPQAPAEHDNASAPSQQRIAQFSFGRDASFGVCIEPACPRATPKTLAGAAPAAIPAAAPAQILPAPTARPVSMIEQPPPIAPMKKTVKTPQPQEPEQIRQLVVGFGFGSAELSAAARATLDSSVQDARRADRIVISGRTDVVGDVKVNQALATSRALAVRDHLRLSLIHI